MKQSNFVWVVLVLVLAMLACDIEDTPAPTPEWPPPTLPVVFPIEHTVGQPGKQTMILEDDFENSSALWVAWAEEPSLASLAIFGDRVRADVDTKPKTATLILRHLHDLPAHADGMTLTLGVEGRPFHLILGVKEGDGSWYHTFKALDPAEGPQTVEISFDWLQPAADSEDENDTLDYEQVTELDIVDISGYVGPVGTGAIEVHKVVFWQGAATPPLTQCVSQESPSPEFLVGVDANFIPEGEKGGTMWFVGGTQVDPLALFAKQGVGALRLRIWVGEDGPSKINYALELAQRAHNLGMQVYPVLFLSEDWADVNKQPAPSEWEGLSLEERAGVIRKYAEETVSQLLSTGIEVPYYAVGNEIDYGISGVFAELEDRDLTTLQSRIWPEEATLIQAAVEGIRQADPEALILLHIAQSYRPEFALAFYRAMRDLGVEYDIAGLSFYPTAFGPLVVPNFCETLDRLWDELDLHIVIAEFAYPGATPTGGMFGAWYNHLPGYPLTHGGQAQWLADFLASLRSRPQMIGAYYFSPAFHWSGELWGPFALFDADGQARPGIGAFTTP